MTPYQIEDKILICRVNRKVLRFSLLWPSEKSELNPDFRYKLLILSYIFLTLVVINIPILIRILLVIFSNEEHNIEDTAVTIATFGTYYMVTFYVKNQKQIAIFQRDLSNFSIYGKPPGFEILDNKLNFFAKLMFSYVFLVTVFYNFVRLPEKEKCKRLRAEKGLDTNHCGMVLSFWLPFKTDNWLVYYFYVLCVLIISVIHMKMCTQISFHLLELTSHLALRLKHLKLYILEAFRFNDYFSSNIKFRFCVMYHTEIMNLAKKADEIFSIIMFGHLTLTGTICACIGKQILDGHKVVAASFHFFAWICALFFGCFGGQILLNANNIIPEALWESNWYESDIRLRKNILIMLMRSQKKTYIGAGSFAILGYPLFVTVLKSCYSILCVLSS